MSVSTPAIPVPTDPSCNPTSVPTLQNWDGLFGQVCQVNIAPGLGDIGACCDEGAEVRVQDGCTQYCKVSTSNDEFSACIGGFFANADGAFETFCQDVNDGIGGDPPSDTTTVIVTTTATETPDETASPTGSDVPPGTSETPGTTPSESSEPGTSQTSDGTTSETAAPPQETGAASTVGSFSMIMGIGTAAIAIASTYFLF